MTKPRLGLGVIGTGMAATPHAMALQDLVSEIDVRGIYSRCEEKRAAFGKRFNFPVVRSAQVLADDPLVDAVLLITPPNQRLELVHLFASAGKHILMEKPLERTTSAAREIVEICDSCEVQLGVVFQHRFRQASQKLRKLSQQEVLGKLRVVQASIPWWREQSYYDEPGRGTYARDGGGVLISQAIHTLDLMLSLTGPVAEVQSLAATTALHQMEAEDFVAGAMRFEGGAVGSLMATTACYPGDAESLTLGFDNASAHLQSGTLTITWRDGNIETYGEPANTGGGADPMAFPHDWHRDLIADFAQSVTTARTPQVTGHQALQVHILIDAFILSSREKRAISLSSEKSK